MPLSRVGQSPLWVISGDPAVSALCPLYPEWAAPQVSIWLPVYESTLYVTNATSISVMAPTIAIAQAATAAT
jgi:hypothetical protein